MKIGDFVQITDTGDMYSGEWVKEDFFKMFPDTPWKDNFEFVDGENKWYDERIRAPENVFVVTGIGTHPYHDETVCYIEDIETELGYLIGIRGLKVVSSNEVLEENEYDEEAEFDLDLLFS